MPLRQQELIEQYIERLPGEGLGDARVRPFDINVWDLILYLQNGAEGDPDVVARDYDISRASVDAALAYYQDHRAVIDARIIMNLDVGD